MTFYHNLFNNRKIKIKRLCSSLTLTPQRPFKSFQIWHQNHQQTSCLFLLQRTTSTKFKTKGSQTHKISTSREITHQWSLLNFHQCPQIILISQLMSSQQRQTNQTQKTSMSLMGLIKTKQSTRRLQTSNNIIITTSKSLWDLFKRLMMITQKGSPLFSVLAKINLKTLF